jgi:hypothetical protein
VSAGNWLLIAVVAASTLIGTALVAIDWAAKRRAARGITPPIPAAAIDEPNCEAPDGIWTCTRPPGHEGDHAAHGKNDIVPVRTWPRKPGEDR